ncbi:MAG TPA: proline dehydrogenase family protein [Flavipsychrobacter sp.]|nr:proline dehydrogenase family protein [Flavipsychrobacter sp.]
MHPQFDDTEIAFRYRNSFGLRKAKFLFSLMASPLITKIGSAAADWAISWGLPVKGIIKNTIFKQFCGGETMEEAANTAAMLHQFNVDVILDYGVEGKAEEAEYDKAVPEFIKAIKYAASQQNIPFISVKITGFGRFGLLEKIHTGQTLTKAEQEERQRIYRRINEICSAAAHNNIMVLIDAEETWIQNPVNDLANAMMKAYNTQKAVVYNTFQLYTTLALPYLKESLELAKTEGYVLGAKLVRGAYMEKERKRAAENGYTSPIQPDKASTDRDYNEALLFCMENLDKLDVFIGTHNENSCMLAVKYMEANKIPAASPNVYFSQLYGMSDNISFNLANAGYHVAKYLPYGPVKDVIPYLIRRAQENTSVAGQTGRELSLINKELKRRKKS